MAVLIEGLSVVIRIPTILKAYPGGKAEFEAHVPNRSWCADGELIRVGFMHPMDIKAYVAHLESMGLTFRQDGKAVDLVVADQRDGFTLPCSWAEFGYTNWQDDPQKRIAVCQLVGGNCPSIFTPPGWTYEKSLSSQFRFVPEGWAREFLQFLRNENGVDVYRDLRTGQEVYVGRTSPESNPY